MSSTDQKASIPENPTMKSGCIVLYEEADVTAIKVETTIDETTARAIPELRPLLGRRVEIIARQTESERQGHPERKLTIDEFFAARLIPPPGIGPISLEAMERAIEEGASGAID